MCGKKETKKYLSRLLWNEDVFVQGKFGVWGGARGEGGRGEGCGHSVLHIASQKKRQGA